MIGGVLGVSSRSGSVVDRTGKAWEKREAAGAAACRPVPLLARSVG